MSKKKKNFVIIDSHALIHRAYHAVQGLSNQHNEPTNAVYGFTTTLLNVLKEFEPHYFVAAFDEAGPTFRNKMFEEYKATRKAAPDDLYAQIPRIKEILEAFKVPVFMKAGFEGDDIIGTVAHTIEEKEKDVKVIIVSGDLDTLQLVSGVTSVYTMKRKITDTIIYNERAVKEKYGFKPEYTIDYKGLRGDPSDNIPGVRGVGEKTASILIQKFSTLENLYKEIDSGKDASYIGVTPRILGLLKDQREEALFSKELATIRKDVPLELNIEEAKWGGFDSHKVRQIFEELNFKNLLKKFEEIAGTKDPLFEYQEANDKEPLSRKDEMIRELEQTHEEGILSKDIYKLEKDVIDVVIKMEDKGIKIDDNALNVLKGKIDKELKKIEKKIYKISGKEFNINSPKQLSEILFSENELNISSKGIKKTSTKNISTSASELEKLIDEHVIVPEILHQRRLQKILSTYVIPLSEFRAKDGRIHTTFHSLGTSTGRMSSSDPNLQNIPIRGEWAAELREVFIANKGKKFLACDYSQMELRVVAHIARDKNMIEAFKGEQDIHKRTASLVFGVEENKVTSDMRYRAKALNFGIIYGIGARAFARNAKISVDEAQDFIDRYFSVFHKVSEYMESAKQKARDSGFAVTMFGRKRLLPDIHSQNPQFRAFSERVAINMPIQGTVADIVKMAMVETDKKFSQIDLLLQIHDELLWEGDKNVIAELKPRIIKTLEKITSLDVPLKVDSAISDSWSAFK